MRTLFVPLLFVLVLLGSRAGSQEELPAYSVIRVESVPRFQKTFVVRVPRRIPTESVGRIAAKLEMTGFEKYETTRVLFLLPWSIPGMGAWAISETRSGERPRVEILGLSREEAEKLVSEPVQEGFEAIGRWINDQPGYAGRWMVLAEASSGKFFLERKFKDGSGSMVEATERVNRLGRFFDSKAARGKEIWLVKTSGRLAVFDNAGLIFVLTEKF